MAFRDEWQRDPSVQRMRRLFARMEALQRDLLERSKVSPHDERLRKVRRSAHSLFERLVSQAEREGLIRNEEDVPIFYLHCFVKALGQEKIFIPEDVFPGEGRVYHFLSEKMQ